MTKPNNTNKCSSLELLAYSAPGLVLGAANGMLSVQGVDLGPIGENILRLGPTVLAATTALYVHQNDGKKKVREVQQNNKYRIASASTSKRLEAIDRSASYERTKRKEQVKNIFYNTVNGAFAGAMFTCFGYVVGSFVQGAYDAVQAFYFSNHH